MLVTLRANESDVHKTVPDCWLWRFYSIYCLQEWHWRRATKYTVTELSQFRCVRWPGIYPGTPRWQAGD